MRTLYSITFAHLEGGETVVDYVAGPDSAGWYRHEFDADGLYVSLTPTDISALTPVHDEGAAVYAHELARLAHSMNAALDRLRGPGARQIAWDRREVLERLDWVSAFARRAPLET